jgi:hypothetical protein
VLDPAVDPVGTALDVPASLHLVDDLAGARERHPEQRRELALAGRAVATVAGCEQPVEAGEALIVPAGDTFDPANPYGEPFEAVAVMPVGGRATIPGDEPFVPPWAE